MKITRSANTAFRIISGQAYVINTTTSTLHELDETGTFIWKLIDSSKTSQQIAQKLYDEYDVTLNQARTDVDEFINSLKSKGLIQK